MSYTFRGRFGDEIVEVEMTAEQAFDFIHHKQPITTIGDGEPIVDEDGLLGERHVTGQQAQASDPRNET